MTQVTKKPKKEDYGYSEQELTGEQGGWQLEDGEDEYQKALELWKQQNKIEENK